MLSLTHLPDFHLLSESCAALFCNLADGAEQNEVCKRLMFGFAVMPQQLWSCLAQALCSGSGEVLDLF